MNARERLSAIVHELQDTGATEPVTVRTLLSWFGMARRGRHHRNIVRSALERAGLVTNPDFAGAYIDGTITFALKSAADVGVTAKGDGAGHVTVGPDAGEVAGDAAAESVELLSGAIADPTYRISRLQPANKPPLSVTPETPLQEAVTQMLLYDYSQLPVMQSAYTVKGAISWRSIGRGLALKVHGAKAKDFLEDVRIIASTESIFTAIPQIVQHEFVLVRNEQNQITGILTTTDLSEQLRTLTEPFLLLDEIENHLRRIVLEAKYTLAEAKAAQHGTGDPREIESVADLTFGEYIRLLDHDERWLKITLPIDRNAFVKQLDKVRQIRNDVMHFDPEGVGDEELNTLRSFVAFLQSWQKLTAG